MFRHAGELRREDRKGYRPHRFAVPRERGRWRSRSRTIPGQEFPHSLLTLSLFDPRGFRGAGHRYAPRQTIRLEAHHATPGFLAGPVPAGEWMVEVDVHCVIARPDGAPNRYEPPGERTSRPRRGAPGPRPATGPPSPWRAAAGGIAASCTSTARTRTGPGPRRRSRSGRGPAASTSWS